MPNIANLDTGMKLASCGKNFSKDLIDQKWPKIFIF